jgi:nucleotide-binding universal stress UspA family protein
MQEIETILCPVDFSEFSIYAYEYAQSIAWHYKARLLLQYVLFSPKPIDFWNVYPDSYEKSQRKERADTERQLQEFANRHTRTEIRQQCCVQEAAEESSVTDSILSLAESQTVNLIVIGTHGLRGFDRLVLGSVAEKVLRRAACPVLTVRKPAHHVVSSAHDPGLVHLNKMLFCADFSDPAHSASKYAFSIAKEYGAELTLLHVLEDIPKSQDLQSATATATKRLEEYIAPETRDGYDIKVMVRRGKPYQEITQVALEAQADLVIMGVRGHGSLHAAIFGSTTYRVIQLGAAPVLTVHV